LPIIRRQNQKTPTPERPAPAAFPAPQTESRYNRASMANRAYLRVWTRDFSEATMIAEFARFLTTAPLAESRQYFNELIVQAIDPTETPSAEWDVHDGTYGAPEIAALAAQHLNSDTTYIVHAKWDLWTFDIETVKWKRGPEPLILTCNGPDFDN